LASERSLPAAHPLQSADAPFAAPDAAKAIVPQFDEQKSIDSARAPSPRLTIDAVRPQQADETVRLTVSAADAGANAVVVIGGVAPGSALSAGTQLGPNTWRVSVEELTGTVIMPPRGFVGAMDLTLELRLADNTAADRKSLRLEWSGDGAPAPAKSQPRRLATSEIALMVKSGTEYMANGNVGAARMMLQPAAEAGDPVAAFALAETFDPLVLRKLNTKGGIAANVGLAQTWYQKAKDLGSAVAPERLERLARLPE
jgi:TPR repeat protein